MSKQQILADIFVAVMGTITIGMCWGREGWAFHAGIVWGGACWGYIVTTYMNGEDDA
jgi:hypothetical protein